MKEDGLLKKLLNLAGINRAVGYGITTRVWSLLAGPITILIIASKFSAEQQGFYYTFYSLLAIQIFFELGLSTVIIQFTSHEFALLKWGQNGTIEGEDAARGRFLDIARKSVFFYFFAALLLVVVLIPIGLAFFNNNSHTSINFSWRLPWVLAVMGTAGNLFLMPFYSSILGSGEVAAINRRQLIGSVIGNTIMWVFIWIGWGLYAIFAYNLGNFISLSAYFIQTKKQYVKQVLNSFLKVSQNGNQISWWRDIWPMQWKIAISWVSGYFIYQLFNPVLFHYQGPVAAGQMGITLTLSNGLLGICLAWVMARNPDFGKLIAQRNWHLLDKIFYKILIQSSCVGIIGATSAWIVLAFIQAHFPLGKRFVPSGLAFLLLLTTVVTIVSNCFATYLRLTSANPSWCHQ